MVIPFVCTNNSYGIYDHGIPIVARKSTDYRTATKKCHRFIPSIAQEYDCTVKARYKPVLLEIDPGTRDEAYKSTCTAGHGPISLAKQGEDYYRASEGVNIHYVRDVQEKVKTTPPPIQPEISEMKDNYRLKQSGYSYREVAPPNPYNFCEVKALGRDEQSPCRPALKGYWKWTDPYMTTYQCTHMPFTKDQWDGIARKDTVTYYDASGASKVKGFGPRNGPACEPLVSRTKYPISDQVVFKKRAMERIVHEPTRRVPHSGIKTEYQGNFKRQTFSSMYPYLFQNGVPFDESLSSASVWQNLPAPGMYCTDNCHIGTNWSVSAVLGLPKDKIIHQRCFTKFTDRSQ